MQQKLALPYPPLQVRAGVLVVDGYGISLRVLYGKLHVEDGIADKRRSIVLDRTGSNLERLVLLGKTGSLTLEALAWLRAIGACLVHLSPDGALLTHSVPYGYAGHPIRRAQALAPTTGLDLDLARDLLRKKLDGQHANLLRMRADLAPFDRLRESLLDVTTIDDLRLVEAQAAAMYWNAWPSTALRFDRTAQARIPNAWKGFGARASALTNAPRAATNPVNSLLNYLYALLESETRIALLAQGLDPTLGVLHADQRNRDSFALDCMEPIRPDVDAFVLDLLAERVFTVRDFVEMPNGVCRVRTPLTHDLALTLGRWRLLVAPIVAHLAAVFRSASGIRGSDHNAFNAAHGSTLVTAAQSPLQTRARQRSTSQPTRPYASKTWNAPRPEAIARIPIACASCGKPVLKRRRRYCETCLPLARRERGLRAIAKARDALALQTLKGNDPRASAQAGNRRAAANAEHHRQNREWVRTQNKSAHDREWFLRQVTPKLDTFSLTEIAKATGFSLAACSRFRTGTRVPHPRHWPDFEALVQDERAGRLREL